MNRILGVCFFALTFVANLGPAVSRQTAAAGPQHPSFAGTWKGMMNDLPGIDLSIQEAGKKISGSVVFHFQERADVNSPWHATADTALPLLNPHASGSILTFEVEHHVCDGCAEIGPNRTFRMELVSANEARLTKFEEDGTEGGTQMKLIRRKGGLAQASPQMREGISVEMPVTSNGLPVPDADQQGALIVTVLKDGIVYLGVERIDADALAAQLQETSQRTGNRLYIKADARASYAAVMKILDAAAAAGIARTVLLTSQHESTQTDTVAPPHGFTMATEGCMAGPRLQL